MSSGILFALAIAALSVAVIVGLVKRNRGGPGPTTRGGLDSPNTVAQWTEGETTRLLSSAELPGLYLLRPAEVGRIVWLDDAPGGVLATASGERVAILGESGAGK